MADNRLIHIGPVALGAAVANIANPPTLTGGVGVVPTNTFLTIYHIRIVNKTASAASYSLYLGATGASAAGTEVVGNGKNVPPNSVDDWYGELRLDTADFLTGNASAATTLTFEAEAEIGVA